MSFTEERAAERGNPMDKWGKMATDCNMIDPALYAKYEVKRGLRDISGRGVLAGLTRIGEVHAYILNEGEMVPVPGRLIYRGYFLSDLTRGFLAEDRMGFEETCYLLLFGELPDARALDEFNGELRRFRHLPNKFVRNAILALPNRDIMNVMARGVLALYGYDEQPDDTSIANVLRQSIGLIARLPIMAVYAYMSYAHTLEGRSMFIHRPLPTLSTAENILRMLRPDRSFTRLEAVLLDLALVLHAEHGGGNNSSFVTHVVTSSGTDTYSAIAAALGSLKGPRHGGANVKVVEMFDELKRCVRDWADEDEIAAYLAKLLNREAFDRKGLIYGMGHAVYSISDPRSKILKSHAEELAKQKGVEEEYRLYERVERLAPEVIGKARKIYKGVSANVDFYSGFVYHMLGIPRALFTPLFAMSRIVGWSAHRIEELANEGKIIRPAYKSLAARRPYAPMDGR